MTNQKRKAEGINAGSMADVAFLLLIFFLVVTTIQTDQGIVQKLPPVDKDTVPLKNTTLHILVNKDNRLMVDGKEISLVELKETTKTFITNPKQRADFPSNPRLAVVSLQNDISTSYEAYIKVLNELHAAYNELRSEYSLITYQKEVEYLSKEELIELNKAYPIKISEADPVAYN